MIRVLTERELEPALALADRTFLADILPQFSEEGRQTAETFLQYKYDAHANALERDTLQLWGCYLDETLIAMIGIRDGSHICLLFVEKAYQRQGIGRILLARTLRRLEMDGVSEVTVNAAPGAEGFYEKMGFWQTDAERDEGGIRYTPMKLMLY